MFKYYVLNSFAFVTLIRRYSVEEIYFLIHVNKEFVLFYRIIMKLKHLAFGLMFTIGLVSLLNFQSGTRIIQEYMEYMEKELFDIPRMLSQNTCN